MIWSLPLVQNHLPLPASIPKGLQEMYLLVHNLVQQIEHKNQLVANISFQAIALYMDEKTPSSMLNQPNSTSSGLLSVEMGSLELIGSCLRIKNMPLVSLLN
ncbi:hypothetical protein O181_006614 [Austropuccinia psidii MF-1]|uniref:Uncharacterized protein n=1 Tax=Austropuccinia psidii MF-1 TaxID=1389203 RepID=A0A9Q3GH23_9BASI|nr:hypothetical protein [Austropuccinia psidii MF-1]